MRSLEGKRYNTDRREKLFYPTIMIILLIINYLKNSYECSDWPVISHPFIDVVLKGHRLHES